MVGPANTFKGGFTCVSDNVVYAIKCKRYHMIYIGETCRRLGDRFVEHKNDVTKEGKDCPVGNRFRQPGHSIEDMHVTVLLETVSGQKQRQFLEQRIISFLGTVHPLGMNVKTQGIYNIRFTIVLAYVISFSSRACFCTDCQLVVTFLCAYEDVGLVFCSSCFSLEKDLSGRINGTFFRSFL